MMNDKTRNLKTLLIQLRSDIFNKDKESALSKIENIFEALDSVKSEIVIYDFLFFCVTQIKSYLTDENFARAYDLTDCIHVIPDIVTAPEKDWKEYWEIYVEKYMNDWNDFSQMRFKEQILILR